MKTIRLITTLLALSCWATSCQEIDSLKTLASNKMVEMYSQCADKKLLKTQWQERLPSHLFKAVFDDAQTETRSWLGALKKTLYFPEATFDSTEICCVSTDDRLLAVPGNNGSIRLYSTDTAQIKGELEGHSTYLSDMCFADDKTLVSAAGRNVTIWDVADKKELKSFKTDAPVVRFFLSSEKSELYCLLLNGFFQTWDLINNECTLSIKIPYIQHIRDLRTMRKHIHFKKNKQLMIFDFDYNKLRILNLKDGTYCDSEFKWLKSYSLLPEKLVWAREDYGIEIFNISNAQSDCILKSHTDLVNTVKFFKSLLISSSHDESIKIWDIKQQKCLRTLVGHTAPIICMKIHKKQKLLYTGDLCGYVKVWDMFSGRCLHTIDATIPKKENAIHAISFLDSAHLLCETAYNISIWNIAQVTKSYCCLLHKSTFSTFNFATSPSSKVVLIPHDKNRVLLVCKPSKARNMVTRCPSILMLFPVTLALGVSFVFLYYLA